MRIKVTDSQPLDVALEELSKLSGQIPPKVLERLVKRLYDLVSIKYLAASGTVTATLEPSALLLDLITAVRAGDIDEFVLWISRYVNSSTHPPRS